MEKEEEEEEFITSGNWRGKHNLLSRGECRVSGVLSSTTYHTAGSNQRFGGDESVGGHEHEGICNLDFCLPACHLYCVSAMHIPCHPVLHGFEGSAWVPLSDLRLVCGSIDGWGGESRNDIQILSVKT